MGALIGAQGPPAHANVVGNDTQNFNPSTHKTDFVTVQSSSSLAPGRFSLSLFANSAANSLPYEDGDGQHRGRINDTLTGMDLGIGVGITRNLELGLGVPFVLHQTVKDDETRGEFLENGNTGARLSAKWTLLYADGFGLAAIASANAGRTAEDPYTGVGSSPIYHLELAADQELAGLRLGANLGYRLRDPGERVEGSIVDPMTNQLLASVAVAIPVGSGLALIGEIVGSDPTGDPKEETDRSTANAEATFGVKQSLRSDLFVHAGAGTELMQGLSTPDWRIYAGLVTELGANAKGDRVASRPNKKKKRDEARKLAARKALEMAAVPEEEPDEVFILRDIKFEFDSDHRVLPGAFDELDKLARHLKTTEYRKILVEGHCDYFGSDEYNDDLSARRAKSVRKRLIKTHGMSEDQIASIGYGERQPMTDRTSDSGRQVNRRVEIKIYRD